MGTLTQLCVCKLYKSPMGSEGVKEETEKAQRGGEKKGVCKRGNISVPGMCESYVNQSIKQENVRFCMMGKVKRDCCF